MNHTSRTLETVRYLLIAGGTFLALQSVVVVMHELTHSTVAWMLGHMRSPFDIIWGNPVTMTGWDEGVSYSELFAAGHLHTAGLIGVSPLILHTVIVSLGMVVLLKKGNPEKKWSHHLLFWFVIANLMELYAYIIMRSFTTHGDVGIFNRGFGLSPWIVFTGGTLALAAGLYVLFRNVLPVMYRLFARDNHLTKWALLFMTAFILFIWGSGLRVVLYIYPDPQWLFGLLGFATFGLALFLFHPTPVSLPEQKPL